MLKKSRQIAIFRERRRPRQLRQELLMHKSARVCHLHGENLPQHRRLSATSPAPFHQKALPAIPPTELGDTNLLLRVLEYCTAVTFFPKAQCAATACGFQHPSFGRSIAKKRYPCTWTRRLTSSSASKNAGRTFCCHGHRWGWLKHSGRVTYYVIRLFPIHRLGL